VAAKVSFVIPAYREERRLPASLKEIRQFLDSTQLDAEVIVVIEKSPDRTVEVSRAVVKDDPRFNIVANTIQRGKGYAVKCGMLKATGEIVIFMDADLSTPLEEVPKFLAHFDSNPKTDVIIGSRSASQSQIIRRQGWVRQTMGRTFNAIIRIFGLSGIEDTQCGFKAFRGSVAEPIFSRQTLDGFAFDVEVLTLATKLGHKIDVLPVKWENSPDSKVHILLDPLKMLWDVIRIRRIVSRTLRANPAKTPPK
jgi:glycosyltransferase involved in cell wall biosynthesis